MNCPKVVAFSGVFVARFFLIKNLKKIIIIKSSHPKMSKRSPAFAVFQAGKSKWLARPFGESRFEVQKGIPGGHCLTDGK